MSRGIEEFTCFGSVAWTGTEYPALQKSMTFVTVNCDARRRLKACAESQICGGKFHQERSHFPRKVQKNIYYFRQQSETFRRNRRIRQVTKDSPVLGIPLPGCPCESAVTGTLKEKEYGNL
jgi:hypothetical protein